jgi:hypothetical protein
VSAPSGSSPAEIAKTREPGGAVAVAKTRTVLGELINFHRGPQSADPFAYFTRVRYALELFRNA